ncbi:S8 family serine peptidase [Streptomyces sp. 130]|uniref:S8 family serine peptidase n=1 Tax=Streptomyces sp. 130 TaxID=2591006 RepID=UPI00163D9FB9|nr:S8 family serine peptidase [Streptomyces sp. 130]
MTPRQGRPGTGRARRAWGLLLAAGLAAAGLPAATTAQAAPASDTAASVERALTDDLADGGSSTFWVYLRDEADLKGAAEIKDRSRQGREVHSRLREAARTSQSALIGMLRDAGASYTPFWIADTVEVKGDAKLLKRITALPEVDRVTGDRTYGLPEMKAAQDEPTVDDVEWGVDRIGAPRVWKDYQATGEGIVVGSIDSGVQYDHPALVKRYRGNNGDGTFTHDYNWYDPTISCGIVVSTPCDNVGHGTHTVGTMTGDGGTGNHVGVAPGAEWIAAKGCAGSTCSQRDLLAAGQYMLAPTDARGKNPRPDLRPHVVNNSWGSAAAGDDPWFEQTVQAWVAAGIFPVFSNGNEGPDCGTDGNPGNLRESYGVGAFDADGTVASFSSRGPSEFDDGLVKPDVSAPGVAVRSTYPGGKYAVGSGTSMAAPHVAGAIALLWSAAPAVARDIDATRRLLDETAVDVPDVSCGGTAGDNNVYGQGRLDVRAAVEKAPRGTTGTLSGTVTDAATGEPVEGVTVQLTAAGDPVGLPATTDAEGRYTTLATVGDYTVTTSSPAYTAVKTEVTITESATATADIRLPARPGKVLSVTPDDADFGAVPVGTTGGPVAVTLTSLGSKPVTVVRVTDHDGAFVAGPGTCGEAPFRLKRKETCTLDLTFRPTEKTAQDGRITLLDDAKGLVHTVRVHGSGTAIPARTAALGTSVLQRDLHAAAIDPQGRYAYFGTDNPWDPLPGYITKVDLKTFRTVGTLSVGIGQKSLQDAVIDPAGRYAYFAVAATPGRVVRVDLATFTLDKILLLGPDEGNLRSALMDPAGKYAYFGTGTDPGRLVKVDLATFTRAGAVTLGAGDDFLDAGVIDSKGEFAYFGTVTSPQGRVVKIDLAAMKEAGSLVLPSGEGPLRSAVIAPDDSYAYFGTGEGARGKIVRVDLKTFARAGAIAPSGGGAFFSAVMDPGGRFAAFGTLELPGHVVTVDLERFESTGYVVLAEKEDGPISGVIDPQGAYAYFGTKTAPGRVVKVRVGARFELAAEAGPGRLPRTASLTWNGATTEKVRVFRNGRVVATVPNTGRFTDLITGRRLPSYTYKLCDTATDRCSAEAKVAFGG